MSTVYMFMADGLEEMECLAAADVLRRGGVDTVLVSIGDDLTVTGAHGIRLVADKLFDEIKKEPEDVLYLPGGMPGTLNLKAHEGLTAMLADSFEKGEKIAAICAAPSILGERGMLKGRKAICYPGFESALEGAEIVREKVVNDLPFVTGVGPGAAVDMGLELVRILKGEEAAREVAEGMCYA